MQTTTQDKPEAGKVYSLFNLAARGTWAQAEVKATSLPLGARVSFGNMATPRTVYVVTEAEGNAHGQRCITLDGAAESRVSESCFAAQQWRREAGEAGAQEIADLVQLRRDVQAQFAVDQARKHAERDAAAARGKELLAARTPAGAVAVLVAVLDQDDCDSMTDYFSARTMREVILAFSTHKRDLFDEMRKAAALLPETAHLATAGAEAEHREKWSMGGGYYLKEGSRYSSGWKIKKRPLAWGVDDIAGRPDGWAPHFTQPKPQPEAAADNDQDDCDARGDENWAPGRDLPAAVAPAVTGGVVVRLNTEKGGVEIVFPDKPAESVRAQLKRAGFRWSRFGGCWWARNSQGTIDAACAIARLGADRRADLLEQSEAAAHQAGVQGMEIALGIA